MTGIPRKTHNEKSAIGGWLRSRVGIVLFLVAIRRIAYAPRSNEHRFRQIAPQLPASHGLVRRPGACTVRIGRAVAAAQVSPYPHERGPGVRVPGRRRL